MPPPPSRHSSPKGRTSFPICSPRWTTPRRSAENWLRNAIEAIAERKPPEGQGARSASSATRSTRPRRAGSPTSLLVRMDTDTPARLLPTMLDDPAAELRRDAVALAEGDVQKLIAREEKDKAKAALKKLFVIARDRDQVDALAKQLEGMGDKVNLPAKYGFITHWFLIGPFDNTNKAGFAKIYPPETKVDLKVSVEGKDGKQVKWIEHKTADAHGLVDLNKAIGKNMGAVAYAFAVVESKADQAVEIRAGQQQRRQDLPQRQADRHARGVPPRQAHGPARRPRHAEEGPQRGARQGLPERAEGQLGAALGLPAPHLRHHRRPRRDEDD